MIRVENATKLYGQAGPDGAAVHALNGINLTIAAGEFVSIMGPSGCGKSTLLHVLGGLDRLTSGEIFLDGMALRGLDENGLTDLRRRKIGFIFQFFNLLPTLTVEENVRLPGLLQKTDGSMIEQRCAELLESVGLTGRPDRRDARHHHCHGHAQPRSGGLGAPNDHDARRARGEMIHCSGGL
jgi:putative ABC transport system ATP-binding protein